MIVLASQSKTRRNLLEQAGVTFKVQTSPLQEETAKLKLGPIPAKALASELAFQKAEALSERRPHDIIIAADQTLELEGQTFHRPHSKAAAKQQLQSLRGKTHHLHSAIAVTRGSDLLFQHLSTASLTMRQFSESFLSHYLQTVEPDVLLSLGGYHFEGIGIQLFEKTSENHFTILGLPLIPLLEFLRKIGELPE